MRLFRVMCFALLSSSAFGVTVGLASPPLTIEASQSESSAPDEPAGFVLWKAERLAEVTARLDRELGDRALVFEAYGNYDGHSVYLVLRGESSPAELHETESDLYVVRRGRATLVVGGELVDAKRLDRRQQRGSSIRGGIHREIGPGDVVHIPVGVPHQLLFPEEETFLYDLTKFNEEPLLNR